MSPKLTPEQRQAFADAIYAGRKMEAIKQLREMSGLGLKESKDIIESLEKELRAAHPERFKRTSSGKSGNSLLLATLFLPAGFLAWFLWRRR
jgi:hypothetical protein